MNAPVDPPRQCYRFVVWGKVQGVWFRESTRREAERLGLEGRATNLADGSVEVLVTGEPADLLVLANWLQRGPPLARVEKVMEEVIEDPGLKGFSTN